MPHRGGDDRSRRARAAASDAAAVIFQQPNFLGLPRARARDLAAAASNEAGAHPIAHVDLMSLGVLEAPGEYGCAMAIGEGQSAGLPAARTAGRTTASSPRAGLRPPHAGPHRRRDRRRGRPPRVRADAPDPRAAHPPREGDVEHHDEPDAARARRARDALVARARGAARGGGDVPRARRSTRASASRSSRRSRPGSFKEVAFRTPMPARDVDPPRARARRASRLRARPRLRGHGRRPARRGHGEADSVEDVDRLADVLAEVCG